MRQIILITGGAILVFSLVVGGFAFNQASREELELSSRLQSRTQLLAESLAETVKPSFAANATGTLTTLVNRFVSDERLVGLAVYDNTGALSVQSENLPAGAIAQSAIEGTMDNRAGNGHFVRKDKDHFFVFMQPLEDQERVIGALAIVQSATYIDEGVRLVWQENAQRLLLQIILLAATIFALLWYAILRPLSHVAASMRSVRAGDGDGTLPRGNWLWLPLTSEISKMTASLHQARRAASEEARLRLEKIDTPWTAERLKEFIKAYLKDRPIYIVSHAEPFIHRKVGRDIRAIVPAGGVATALSAVMEACGGMWLGYGAGDADKETADSDGKIEVPPDEPKYTLKRVWLSDKELKGYYLGFSNEALWPLSHIAHVRPIFRETDWTAYRTVNGKFAEELLAEIKDVESPLILIQDYHFALLPAMIKRARPDAQVAFFWHIPWPSPEVFSINPWRKDVLQGILGADVVGFHTQQYCNNFIDTVGKELEALIDLEQFSVTHEEHVSHVKPFPISIAFTGSAEKEIDPAAGRAALKRLDIHAPRIILGVDRLDYTKGILERMRAVEFLFDAHPEYRGEATFLQIASPTREGIEKYQEYGRQVEAEVERINAKYRSNGWKPIVLERRQYSHNELRPLYESADVCLITSLHDGMNLVAKEFVAARSDEAGALVLSQFTGAARDLRKGAIIVNPYSAEETADALHQGLSMSPAEQHRCMKTMRNAVKDYNVYRWSAELIKAAANLG